mmetsp:Transcript_5334/g.21845  ORF Transcript_5334/g.21845 Transcript_5334/m.21845 type:complete len:259 (-) Transcript_5334:1204-1980(-)
MQDRGGTDDGEHLRARLLRLHVRVHVPPVPLQGLQGHRHSFARHHPADHRNLDQHALRVLGLPLRGARGSDAQRGHLGVAELLEPYIQLQPRRRDVVAHAARTHRTRRARTPAGLFRAQGRRGSARGWREAAPVREDPGREGLGAEGGLPYPGSRVRRPHGAGDLRHGARGEGVAGPNQQVPAHRGMGRVVSGGWRRGVSRRAVQGEGHRPRVRGRGLRGCDARGGVFGRISHAREPRPVCGVAVHGRGRLVTLLFSQ